MEIITFVLRRSSNRRTLMVRIKETSEVEVVAPLYVSVDVIDKFIQDKTHWINRKISEIRLRQASLKKQTFAHGEFFLFLGKRYPVSVSNDTRRWPKIIFTGGQWNIILPSGFSTETHPSMVKQALWRWYHNQAKEIFGGRIFHFARILQLAPRAIVIKQQKRLWGSCSFHRQTIHLNWQIVMAPLWVVDYVVVHELCHLKIPNHSQRFWSCVHQAFPDYKEAKRWLKGHAQDMQFPVE